MHYAPHGALTGPCLMKWSHYESPAPFLLGLLIIKQRENCTFAP